MSETLTRFGASLSLPLLILAALLGAGVGYARYQSERQTLQPVEFPSQTPLPEAYPQESPSVDPSPEESLASPTPAPIASPPASASRAGAQRALDGGDFAEAIRQAEVVRADEIRAEAYLLQALTRSIPPGDFARAEVVTEVTLAGVATPLLGIVSETGDKLLVIQIDGRERRLGPGEVKARRELRGSARLSALRAQLAAAREELGATAGGLALHRLAYLAFSADLRPLGTKLLRQALQGRDGAILVDMFGEGDFKQLHAARRALAGEAEPVAVARRDPVPIPSPGPEVETPDVEAPEPSQDPIEVEPLSSDMRPGERHERPEGPDDVIQSEAWKRADESYKAGLEVYRGTFGLSNRAASIGVKAALGEFERAQELLGPLSERNPEHFELERRQEELAKLIIDCHRRQNVGD